MDATPPTFSVTALVTTGSVTRHSREVVEGDARVRLMTYDELERDLFHPDPALARWLEHYQREPISRRFVEVTATQLDRVPARDFAIDSHLPSTSLLDVAISNPLLAIVVLADYGSGKSTMLERVKALAIKRRSGRRADVVPILIRLRTISPDFDVEKVALDAVRTELGVDVPAEIFWGLLRSGRFLILLDGFDEITLQASAATRERMLGDISPLLFNHSPAILTSRPSYFASLDEYRALLSRMRSGRPKVDSAAPDLERIDRRAARLVDRYRDQGPTAAVDATAITYKLNPLSSEQIDLFLQLAAPDLADAGTTPQEVRRFLDGVYDLSDLISRPIILDMAVRSTVDGLIKPSQKTLEDGPAGLYELYAQVRLERDWVNVESRQQLLTHEIRMRFAEECALYMEERDALRVERDKVTSVAARTCPIPTGDDLEAVLTDLRTCSFLTIDPNGALEFIHRSYQEFFVARRIRDDLGRKSVVRLRAALRWEYAYFLGSMGYTNDGMYREFTELARSRPGRQDPDAAVVADNAAQLVLIARDVARDLDWHDRRVDQLRRSRSQILGSTLQNVEFCSVRADHLQLTDCTLALRITGDPLGEITLTSCSGAVELSGDVGSISLVGGNLNLRNLTQATTLAFDSLDLVLRSGDGHHRFHSVVGRVELESSTVDIERSELTLVSSGEIDGTIADALVDVALDSWDLLSAQITRSAVVVHGVRPRSSVSGATQRKRKVTDLSPAGLDSVVVADPSVVVDRWWPRQSGLVTIGARIADSRTQLLGLFVHERQRPTSSQERAETNRASAGHPDVLTFSHHRDGTVVMDGRGPHFDTARDRLSDLVANATARSIADGRWVKSDLRPLLEDLGCPQDAIGQLIGLVESRVGATGPHR